ncbi:MAG TPA: hypothetical protein VMT52_09285 [Planctomycetota bacterium]|nr:hypothetical protein [Planctomycetota bacterium]
MQPRVLRSPMCAAVLACAFLLPIRPADAGSLFVRGDANGDGSHDISDPLSTLFFLFIGGFTPGCLDALDINDDGAIELTDAVASLVYLYAGGQAPSAPFPICGADTTPSSQLGCEVFPHCGDGAPPSGIIRFLRAISLDGTEPCCFDGLGLYAVRAGMCEELGGSSPGTGNCAVREGSPPSLQWALEPPHTLLDPLFTVALAPLGPLDADLVTLDLFAIDADGERVGPIRAGAGPFSRSGLVFAVNVLGLEPGSYTVRATAWKLSQPRESVELWAGGEDFPVEPPVIDVAVAVADLPAPFRVGPTAARVASPIELAGIESAGLHGDPALLGLVHNVEQAEQVLRSVEAALSTPQIESLRGRVRRAEEDRAGAISDGAAAAAEIDALERERERLRRELEALRLVNKYLDSYFGPKDLAAIKDLIKRREAILEGTAQDDEDALADALADKKARLEEVEKELEAKKALLETLMAEHAALKDAIRAQFHKTRRTAGDNMGTLTINDDGVDYTITGLLVVNDGRDVIKYAPTSKSYREEKAKLDQMIQQLKDLWQAIQDCEKEIADLEAEKKALEENIEKLENAAGEVEETDEVLDDYFDPERSPHAPHIPDLLKLLEELGYGWLADLFRELFDSVPRTCEELEAFLAKLEELRDQKHAREAEIEDAIEDLDRRIGEAERRAQEAEERRRAAEEEIRRREEELRRAEEEARRAEEDAYRRAQEEAEREAERRHQDEELQRRLEELRRRAQEGDEGALLELMEALGLMLLDEVTGDLKLGTIVGGLLTVAQIPECTCKILKAMRALFAERFDSLIDVHANEVIRQWRECANLPAISSVELGSVQLAQAVRRVPIDQRRRITAALDRALRASGCR